MSLLPHRKTGGSSNEAEAKERQHRLLTPGTSSYAESITDSIVIKDWNLFFSRTRKGKSPWRQGMVLDFTTMTVDI